MALCAVVLLCCTGSALAFDLPAGTYYFDNTVAQWDDVYLRIGRDDYTQACKMSKLPGNANIYYYTFGGNGWENAWGYQFTAVKGKEGSNVRYDDNSDIASAKKSWMCYEGDTSNKLYISTSTVNSGGRGITKTQLPSKIGSSYVVIDGTWYKGSGSTHTAFDGANLGVKAPGGTMNVGGEVSITEGTGSAVSATLNYNLNASAGSYKMVNLPQYQSSNTKKQNATGAAATLPTAAGDYTLAVYFQCGKDVYDSNDSKNYKATYTIPGFTVADDCSMGSIQTNTTSSKAVSLSSVYGNVGGYDNSHLTKIKADLSGAGFSFASGLSVTTTYVDIASKAGSITVYFTPTAAQQYTGTLTLTLYYNASDNTKVVTHDVDLIGYGLSNVPVCNIGAEPTFSATRRATVNGYLQETGCQEIYERGFVYTTNGSEPDASTSNAWECDDASDPMVIGSTWSKTTGTLSAGTYKYKSYVIVGGTKYVSAETGSFTIVADEDCVFKYNAGDTVYVTIDTIADNNPCALQFKSPRRAVNFIKGSSFFTSGNNLIYDVVFQVVPYIVDDKSVNYIADQAQCTTVTGGDATDLPVIKFDDINNGTKPSKVLIVRSALSNVKPHLQHIVIRNSRNIIFDNVHIAGSPKAGTSTGKYDNAMDIDTGSNSWQDITEGGYPSTSTTANIVIKNCYIESSGFTCVHVAGYNGVTFENNDIEAHLADAELTRANTVYWGSSIKLIQCKNFSFLRNNFRGSHATSLWFQGVSGALLMNNVFWNKNNSYNSTYAHNNAFIRLITQFTNNLNNKIGIYYNTFYIANGAEGTTRNMDFFRVGSNYSITSGNETITLNENTSQNTKASILFKYNNCYSYDAVNPDAGKNGCIVGANITGNEVYSGNMWYAIANDEANWCSSIQYNNFWSQYDEDQKNSESDFGIPSNCGTDTKYFINVAELVCTTGAEDPASLVIKGGDLNLGKAPSANNTGLGENTYFNDRLHASNGNDAIRNESGSWTLGAYQQSEGGDPATTIIWYGDATGSAAGDWDNRNNWRKIDKNGNYVRLTCVDNIDENVTIIIPAKTKLESKYTLPEKGIENYPIVPNKFGGARTKLTAETVNAGQGTPNVTKFAGSIEIEYGGALKNVQSLSDNEGVHYDQATNNLVVPRNQWVPVGTVIKPFDKKTGEPRLVISEDYYLYGMPHVYMHEAKISDTQEGGKPIVDWGTPFADLDKKVDYDKVFTIKIPNQYGYYKFTAKDYEEYYKVDIEDPSTPKTFPLTGRFLNDEIIPEYKISGNALLCNTLPANMDVAIAASVNHGTFRIWDYSLKRFGSVTEKGTIKPQSGFLFFPDGSNDGYFRITNDMLLNTSTQRGATVENPYYAIMALNTNGDGGSAAAIWLDELKDDVYVAGADAVRVEYSSTPTQPEVYIERYGKELDKLTLPDFETAIPLTLQLSRKMTVQFSTYKFRDIEKAVLEDRETGLKYDLLAGDKCEIALAKGTYQGRFYLNLGADDDIPTVIDDDEVSVDSNEIDIFSSNREVVVTSSEKVVLKEAYITDMSGRTTKVNLKDAHYNVLTLDGMQGVYIIKAVGDNMSRTEKVIVK